MKIRICPKCGSSDRYKSGHCKMCMKASSSARNKANPEKIKAYKSEYYKKNNHELRAASAEYRKNNTEYIKKYHANYYAESHVANPNKHKNYQAEWIRNNPDKRKIYNRTSKMSHPDKYAALEARRRALKVQATPLWANAKKIAEFYFTAQMLGMHTGEPYHVDHIVPLKSKLVCGLHCEENLQILEANENRKKNNLYWPQMPT